jgi:hypothetical protein
VVSSQQLISSSEYFQRVLEDIASAESKNQKENGFFQIRLSEPQDKITAFSIILDILYERQNRIPSNVDFVSTLRCYTRS